jgi:hypothetical protein
MVLHISSTAMLYPVPLKLLSALRSALVAFSADDNTTACHPDSHSWSPAVAVAVE